MGKVKAAAVLGGLMCALLVFLSTWPFASGNVCVAPLLQGAEAAPHDSGARHASWRDRPSGRRRRVCLFVARILKTMPPSTTPPPTPEQLQAAAATGIAASTGPVRLRGV